MTTNLQKLQPREILTLKAISNVWESKEFPIAEGNTADILISQTLGGVGSFALIYTEVSAQKIDVDDFYADVINNGPAVVTTDGFVITTDVWIHQLPSRTVKIRLPVDVRNQRTLRVWYRENGNPGAPVSLSIAVVIQQ